MKKSSNEKNKESTLATKIHLHQTHHSLADFEGIFAYIKENFGPYDGNKTNEIKEKNEITETIETKRLPSFQEGLHLFPELFLTGYPLQDLCLCRSFIEAYLKFLEDLNQWSLHQMPSENADKTALLMGGLHYEFEGTFPQKIENVIYLLIPGQKLTRLYTKKLLPNYDIFDERKYFTPGKDKGFWEWNGLQIGLLLCEDMWHSSVHAEDPVQELLAECHQRHLALDLMVNLSASPFHLGKLEKRKKRALEISEAFQAPFAYTNRVGGEDEILFDGGSFFIEHGQLKGQGKFFKRDVLSFSFTSKKSNLKSSPPTTPPQLSSENTWEGLFAPSIVKNHLDQLPCLSPWNDQQCDQVLKALMFGLQEYAQKTNFQNFTIALSGGMDSALTLAILGLSLRKGQKAEAIYMPSRYSSSQSFDLSHELCQKLKIPLLSLPIKFLHSVCQNQFKETFNLPLENLANENIQSRLRGTLLYTRSNQINSLVINTSNKSELAVGYSTLYGDSVGALSLLGDLYKTEVYQLASYLNRTHKGVIPQGILERAPSAELRENQVDQDSLPPYERLDTILEGILSNRLSAKDLINMGLPKEEVLKVCRLYAQSEYKRKQFCPILKIKPKSFGFGYRIPILKNNKFYLES